MTERRRGLKNRRKLYTYRENDRRSDLSDRREVSTDIPKVRRQAIKDRREKLKSVAVDKRSGRYDRRKSPKNSKNIYEVADSGINMVKAGLAFYLLARYVPGYGQDYAGFLVAAVINFIFDEPPSNKPGWRFLKKKNNLKAITIVIEEAIRPEEMIREIITDAVQLRSFLMHDMNPELSPLEILQHCVKPLDNLKRLGLLVPGRDTPDTYEFYSNAANFLIICKTKSGNEKSP